MLQSKEFALEIDGRRVIVNQANQEVSILDDDGVVIFRDRIQVAAGSVQGLFDSFSASVEDVANVAPSFNPTLRD